MKYAFRGYIQSTTNILQTILLQSLLPAAVYYWFQLL